MNVASNQTRTPITRCAVCKIDLKGRFVVVDELIEGVLGQSMEQLFGKPIAKFLDPEGQSIVKDLLKKHRRYETSFDSCRVNLIGSGGLPIPANLIFSLCFAAGNPVNYQVLIDSAPASIGTNQTISIPDISALNLLQALSELTSPERLSSLVPALAQFIGEPRIAVYRLDGDELVELPSQATAPATIEKTTELHLVLARTGNSYCHDGQAAVRQAVELTGQAPSEFACGFKTSDGCYLIRVILDENLSNKESTAQLKLIRLAATLIGRWINNSEDRQSPVGSTGLAEDEIAAGLHAADLLGAAAITINQSGDVKHYNSTAEQLLQIDLDSCGYRELFIDQLKLVAKDGLARLNLFVEQAFKTTHLPRYESAVLLPDSRIATISVMRSDPSDPSSDLLMMIMPIPDVADAQTTRRTFAMAQSSFDDLQSLGRIASDYASQLSHEYFSHLDGDGNFVLMCLSSCLDKILSSLSGYKEMFQLGARMKLLSKTDLNVLMNELASSLGELAKNIRINISHSDLPTLKTDAQILKTVLRLLLAEVLCEWNEEDFKISVKCTMQKNQAILKIKLPSNCPKSAIDGLIRLTHVHLASDGGRDIDPNPLGLAVDHLLNNLEATIDIDTRTPSINLCLRTSSSEDSPV